MPTQERLRILISNDDGFLAPGLKALQTSLSTIAEVTVVAPDREQSGSSHSLSLHRPLRIRHIEERFYSIDGTPTDCVYVALSHLLKDNPPHIIASGINAGANLGEDLTYSGTVAAAMEGCAFGISSFAISLAAHPPKGYQAAAHFALWVAQALANNPLPAGRFLNINVPACARPDHHMPWRATVLGHKEYARSCEVRVDPRGAEYLWIGGPYLGADNVAGTDCGAIEEGVISVSPVHLDLTAFDQLQAVSGLALGKVASPMAQQSLRHSHPEPPSPLQAIDSASLNNGPSLSPPAEDEGD